MPKLRSLLCNESIDNLEGDLKKWDNVTEISFKIKVMVFLLGKCNNSKISLLICLKKAKIRPLEIFSY